MLPKKYRLPAKDFKYIYRKGSKVKGKYGMLISLPNNSSSTLFGYVVSKKIGNAVLRHRFTRMLRNISIEIVKELDIDNSGFSFEYIAFEFTDNSKLLKEEFLSQIKKSLLNK